MSEQLSRPTFKLLAVGVGGQGVLTATRFVGEAALALGLDVRLGQLHGMSQRGGSVESTVLVGPGQSSFIPPGEADAVLGLEPLEVLRARPRMSRSTRVIVNLGRVVPYPLAMRGAPYPALEQLLEQVRGVSGEVTPIDGPRLCEQAGSARALNIVMLGALASLDVLPFDAGPLRSAIERRSPPRFRETNLKAFELGAEAARAEATTPS